MADQGMKAGSFVISRVPDWGTGKVLEVREADKVRVFFEFAGEKIMLSDSLSPTVAPEHHPVLEKIDRMRTLQGFIPFPNLEASFQDQYKQGFDDPKYLHDERDYKLKASDLFREQLSQGVLAELINSENHAAVCDLVKKSIGKNNLIFPNEKMALIDGLKRGEAEQRLFSMTLFKLLYDNGDYGERFDTFANALEELDACKWPIATYFSFLSDPDHHICVKPSYFQTAARSYAFSIDYVTRPNWACYRRILDFVEYVAGQLAKRDLLKPRDLIDVQGFIWCSLH